MHVKTREHANTPTRQHANTDLRSIPDSAAGEGLSTSRSTLDVGVRHVCRVPCAACPWPVVPVSEIARAGGGYGDGLGDTKKL